MNYDHLYATHGNYDVSLVAVSEYGCKASISKIVPVLQKPLALFIADNHCYGATAFFKNQSQNANRFSWEFGDASGFSLTSEPTYQYFNPGLYDVRLIAQAQNGCTDTIIQSVSVYENPVANFQVNNLCDGKEVMAEENSLGSITVFRWYSGDGNEFYQPTYNYTYDSAGIYSIMLYVETREGCSDSISRDLTVYPTPVVVLSGDSQISKGNSIELTALGGDSYSWTPASTLDNPFASVVSARPLETTTYSVLVRSAQGCEAEKSLTVEVLEDFNFEITTLITPDGNGKNDYWKIKNIEEYDNCQVRVFDRRGRSVYYTSDYQNDWNGSYNGSLLPDGVYYFMIDCNNGEKVYKGTLTIMRTAND